MALGCGSPGLKQLAVPGTPLRRPGPDVHHRGGQPAKFQSSSPTRTDVPGQHALAPCECAVPAPGCSPCVPGERRDRAPSGSRCSTPGGGDSALRRPLATRAVHPPVGLTGPAPLLPSPGPELGAGVSLLFWFQLFVFFPLVFRDGVSLYCFGAYPGTGFSVFQ